jgi:hypothetical protein
VGSCIENRFAAGHGSSQHTGIFADAGPKDITTLLPQCFAVAYLGDVFSRSIEGCDSPIKVDRKNAFIDRIEDCFFPSIQLFGHYLFLPDHCIMH